MGLGVGLTTLPCKKRKLLRSLQEIQLDFVEEAKGLSWTVEPRKEEAEITLVLYDTTFNFTAFKSQVPVRKCTSYRTVCF
jgi:hypothetical protein